METLLGIAYKPRPESNITSAHIIKHNGKNKAPQTPRQQLQLEELNRDNKTRARVRAARIELQKSEQSLRQRQKTLGSSMKDYKEEIKKTHPIDSRIPKNKTVLYYPQPKQVLFHSASEDILLYGGAAGGGKSYCIIMDALRYCKHTDYRALIIRKSSPMLKEIIGVSRALYPKAFPGAKFNKQENVWYFPSGATIEFGYLDGPEDLERYQGLPYAYIAFDEIQHQRTPEGFEFLMSRLRSTNPEITCYMRASANPGGASWIKETFIDPAPENTTFHSNGLSYKFIPARLEDNKYLDTPKEGEPISAYRRMLMALPETKRKQLLEGDWLCGDDQMFAFAPSIHVIKEDVPVYWNTVRAMDYGYRDPAATLWASISPDNSIYVYDEHESLETPAIEWGREIMQKELKDTGNMGYQSRHEEVIDWSLFRNTGHSGPGILETLQRMGMRPKPADRNREAGWNQLHTRLAPSGNSEPTLFIHERCSRLIEQLETARIHPKKPEELDDARVTSKGRTHHWDLLDCLRYLAMARPSTLSRGSRALRYREGETGFDRTWEMFGVTPRPLDAPDYVSNDNSFFQQ